jgi:DNA-directed RNA polymerase specialized sigma subunit
MVVSLYYEQDLNMDEVGEILGFDKSTVCRAHGRALLMLRSALHGWK